MRAQAATLFLFLLQPGAMAMPFGASGMPPACQKIMQSGAAMGSPEFNACMGAMLQSAEADFQKEKQARGKLLEKCSKQLTEKGYRIDGAQDNYNGFSYIAIKESKELTVTTNESCAILSEQKLGC